MKLFILFICCFVLFSCTKNKLVKDFEKQEVPESVAGMEEYDMIEYENEDPLLQKNAHAKLVYADNLIKLDDFPKAIETYLEIYEDEKYKDEQRDEALFKLASAHRNVLNDNADPDKALYYYQLLIAEFPASKYRLQAYQKVGALRIEIEEREMNKNKITE